VEDRVRRAPYGLGTVNKVEDADVQRVEVAFDSGTIQSGYPACCYELVEPAVEHTVTHEWQCGNIWCARGSDGRFKLRGQNEHTAIILHGTHLTTEQAAALHAVLTAALEGGDA
jgi:hypothetical protein